MRGVLRCLPTEQQAQDCESVSTRLPCAGLHARLSATRCRTGAAPCPAASRTASAADHRLPAQAPACAAASDARCSAAPYAHCILPGNEASLMEEALARRRWWRPAEPAAVAVGRFELWWGGNAQRFPVTIFRGGAGPAIGSDVGQAIQDTIVAWFKPMQFSLVCRPLWQPSEAEPSPCSPCSMLALHRAPAQRERASGGLLCS